MTHEKDFNYKKYLKSLPPAVVFKSKTPRRSIFIMLSMLTSRVSVVSIENG